MIDSDKAQLQALGARLRSAAPVRIPLSELRALLHAAEITRDGRAWERLARQQQEVLENLAKEVDSYERRANQANLVRWNLAPEGERLDYEAWSKAEDERRRLAWADRNRALLEAPGESEDDQWP